MNAEKRGPGRPKKTTSTPPNSAPGTPVSDKRPRSRPVTPDGAKSVSFGDTSTTLNTSNGLAPIRLPLASELENPQPKPVQGPPAMAPVSQDEFRAAQIQAMANQQVEASRSRVKQSAATSAKAQKDFSQYVENSQLFWPEKQKLALDLNNLRKKYAGQFPTFQFAKDYTPDMELQYLQSQKQQLDIMLNSVHVPEMMKNLLYMASEIAEVIVGTFNYPYINLTGLKKNMEDFGAKGGFDEEMDQLAIKYASVLSQPPEIRLAAKVGFITVGTGGHNVAEWRKMKSAGQVNNIDAVKSSKFAGL